MASGLMKAGDKLADEELLLRRVYRSDKRYLDPNGRPSSRAFTPRPKDDGKLSVDVRRLTTYAAAVIDENKYRLFACEAAWAHRLGLDCLYDPLTEAEHGYDNPAHAVVVGFPQDDESIPGILARQAIGVDPF